MTIWLRLLIPPRRCPARRLALYAFHTLSYRDVEDLLAERGSMYSPKTVRRWALKFRPGIRSNAVDALSQRRDGILGEMQLS